MRRRHARRHARSLVRARLSGAVVCAMAQRAGFKRVSLPARRYIEGRFGAIVRSVARRGNVVTTGAGRKVLAATDIVMGNPLDARLTWSCIRGVKRGRHTLFSPPSLTAEPATGGRQRVRVKRVKPRVADATNDHSEDDEDGVRVSNINNDISSNSSSSSSSSGEAADASEVSDGSEESIEGGSPATSTA